MVAGVCRVTGNRGHTIERPLANKGSNFSSLTARAGFKILNMADLKEITGPKMRKININAGAENGMFLFCYFVNKLITPYIKQTISCYEINSSESP